MTWYLPLSMLLGAVLLAGGFVAGRIHRPSRTPKPVLPICACTHSLGTHVEGRCGAAVERAFYMRNGSPNGHEWVPCACRRYVGPEHLADVWAPPIAGP